MGLSLCQMARRSFDAAGENGRRVIAVSRFRDDHVTSKFERAGIEMVSVDLLADGTLDKLPSAPIVLYLAGMKFGSSGNLPATWAMNTLLPALVARRYAESRIVALSTGNVYPLTPTRFGGSIETDLPAPVGEYAQSCLGRERMFAHFSLERGTPVSLIRLNYANALRYGVVIDIGRKVLSEQAIDVSMGFVNVIWQGDANSAILRSFSLCASPPAILNVAGPETASVRWIASRFAELLGAQAPAFVGTESETALLSNAAQCHAAFGYPSVPLDQLIAWSSAWLRHGKPLLNKPTGFEVRDGRF